MNHYIITILLLCPFIVFSQESSEDSTARKSFVSHKYFVGLEYGIAFDDGKSKLNDALQNTYGVQFLERNHFQLSFKNPASIGSSSLPMNTFDSEFGLAYWPRVLQNSGDTIDLKMSGFAFNFSFGKDLLYFLEWADLSTKIGFNWGMDFLRIGDRKLRNPYFAPKANTELRFFLGRIALTAKAEYLYDVSKFRWKPDPMSPADDYAFKHQYFSFAFGIGYCFSDNIKGQEPLPPY